MGTTQDNFNIPALHEGGLPLSQDWLDSMKFVHNRNISITLPMVFDGKTVAQATEFPSVNNLYKQEYNPGTRFTIFVSTLAFP